MSPVLPLDLLRSGGAMPPTADTLIALAQSPDATGIAARWALAQHRDAEQTLVALLSAGSRDQALRAAAIAALADDLPTSVIVRLADALRSDDDAVARDAALALYLAAARGRSLQPVLAPLVRAQLREASCTLAAFAIARAASNGDDFGDDDTRAALVETWTVRSESLQLLESLEQEGRLELAPLAPVLGPQSVTRHMKHGRFAARAWLAHGALEPVVGHLEQLAAAPRAADAETALRGCSALLAEGADPLHLLSALERASSHSRSAVAKAASALLAEICGRGPAVRQRLAARARELALAQVAAALDSPATEDETLAQFIVNEDVAAATALLRAAPVANRRALVGRLHRMVRSLPAQPLLDALADLVSDDDDVVRFAALDTAAIALASAEDALDGSRLVGGLVAVLGETRVPALAPHSGLWQTLGPADSAARALARLAVLPASRDATRAALREALGVKARSTVEHAARALATALSESTDPGALAELLRHRKLPVQLGALTGLGQARLEHPLEDPARTALLERHRDPKTCIAAWGIRFPGDAALRSEIDPIPAEALLDEIRSATPARRTDAAHRLTLLAEVPGALDKVRPWLVDALGTDRRPEAVAALEHAAAAGNVALEPLVALIGGLLLDGDDRTQRGDEAVLRCLTHAARRGCLPRAVWRLLGRHLTAAPALELVRAGLDAGLPLGDLEAPLCALLSLEGLSHGDHPSTVSARIMQAGQAAALLSAQGLTR